VDRPQIHHYRLETTLRVPAGQRVLVGGLTYSEPSVDETNRYLFVKASVVSGSSQTDH
jgi:type II secretory pathway component GspD/PulD (secretin)